MTIYFYTIQIFEPKPIEKILNDPIDTQEPDDTFINTRKVIQDMPKFEPQVNFPQPNLDTRDDFKIYPDNEDAIVFKSLTLTLVKNKSSIFTPYKITRGQLRDAFAGVFDDLETIDDNNDTNTADLNDTVDDKTDNTDRVEQIKKIKDFMKGLDTKTKGEIGKTLEVDK